MFLKCWRSRVPTFKLELKMELGETEWREPPTRYILENYKLPIDNLFHFFFKFLLFWFKVCSDDIDPNVTSCCMWPLEIDFNDYKWDWVLYPRKFDANICGGDCSVGKKKAWIGPELVMEFFGKDKKVEIE